MSEAGEERNPVEELAAEFLQRCRQGENPSIEEYAERYPDQADEIRQLFPTMLAMEDFKARRQDSSGGGAGRPGRPERLGDFRIIREIGRGGMGVVYEAEQESLGRRVAIKVMRRTALLDEKDIRRFDREARVAAGLHHPNIVQVYGVGEDDAYLYYVMQLIDGVGLDEVIDSFGHKTPESEKVSRSVRTETFASDFHGKSIEGKEMPPASAGGRQDVGCIESVCSHLRGTSRWRAVASIGLQVAQALDYAHREGAIHRDIKPANLLADEELTVWVADFGLAKATHTDDLTMTGDLAGTLRYMAPEQFRGRADFRTDIHALGLTLYELLAGRPAHPQSDRTSLIQTIMHNEPEPPSKFAPEVPRDLETIVLKAITREPEGRYGSAGEMAEDLERFLDDRPITARRISPLERTWRWARRNPVVATLASSTVLLLLLVAVVATVGYLRTRAALRGEERERRRAEANAELAVGALDRIFDRLAPGTGGEVAELSTEDDDEETITIPSPPVLSDEAVALLEDMLTYYERLATQVGDEAALQRKIAEANCRVGEIRRRLGQYERAVQAYHRGVEIYAQLLSQEDGENALLIHLAQAHNDLGQIERLNQDPDAARESHQRALGILESVLADDARQEEARFERARTHYLLARPGPQAGEVVPGSNGLGRGPRPAGNRHDDARQNRRGRRRGPGGSFLNPRPRPDPVPGNRRRHSAQDNLRAAISELEDLTSRASGLPRYRRLLALCLRENARQLAGRDREAAADSLLKAIDILRRLTDEYPKVPDYRYELAETYGMSLIPGWRRVAADTGAEESRLEMALDISAELVQEHPRVPDYQALHARLLHRRATELLRAGNGREALEQYKEAEDVQSSLVRNFPAAAHYAVWLAVYRQRLAEVYQHRRQVQEGISLMEHTAKILSRTLENSPDAGYVHGILGRTYRILARGYSDAGQALQAAKALDQSRQQTEKFRQWRRSRRFRR